MTWLDDVEASAAADGDPDRALGRLVAFARAVLALPEREWEVYDTDTSTAASARGWNRALADIRALAAEHLGES